MQIRDNLTPPKHKTPGHGLILGAAKVWEKEDHRPSSRLVTAARNIDYRYWPAGDMQDQGNTPQCVEYATRALLEGSPERNQTEHIPRGSMYAWMQDHDEWPGNQYDGTSIHAAMKWLKEKGYVKSYEWAETVEELFAHLMTRGMALAGTSWTKNMSYVDEFGFARFSGADYGGHGYIIRGGNRLGVDPVTRKKGKLKIRNNWGFDYGEAGEAWLTAEDAQKLIDDYGEIALPIELKLPLR